MKFYILLCWLIMLSSHSFSQDLQVTYGVSTKGLLDANQKETLSPDIQNIFKKAQENFKYITFSLKIKDKRSLFSRDVNLMNDGKRNRAAMAGFAGVYYSDSEVGEVFHEYDGYGPKYLISSSLQELKWKISKETKIVTGLTTFKATAQETYDTGSEKKTWTITAWFAPEINKPFGPGGYGGLPGLILELDRGLKTYTAKNIKEVNLKKEEVNIPASGKKITKKEFEAIGRKMSEQRSSFY